MLARVQQVQVAATDEPEKDKEAKDERRTWDALRNLFAGYQILGVQLPARHRTAYIIYSAVFNFVCSLLCPLSFFISYFTNTKEELLTTTQVALNLWACVLKFIVMTIKLPILHSANNIFVKLDARCNEPEEFAELRKMSKSCNRFVGLFAAAFWTFSTSTFLSALITNRTQYALYIPGINFRNSRKEFVYAAIIEYALINVACFMAAVDDSYGVVFTRILRTHFGFLLNRIGKLGNNSEMTFDDNLEELKCCIMDHKNLLELYDLIAPVISITIFIQFTVTATIFGMTFLNIFVLAPDISTKVGCFFYIVAVVVEIFPLCYSAQCLSDETSRLADVIFHSNWVHQDRRFRQMLIFFMQRTQCKMEFSAGKLFPITLSTFLSIAKFSFTLFTFIKEMGIKEKFTKAENTYTILTPQAETTTFVNNF